MGKIDNDESRTARELDRWTEVERWVGRQMGREGRKGGRREGEGRLERKIKALP